jgi:hypothetical protein
MRLPDRCRYPGDSLLEDHHGDVVGDGIGDTAFRTTEAVPGRREQQPFLAAWAGENLQQARSQTHGKRLYRVKSVCQNSVHFASSSGYNHLKKKQQSGGLMVNVSDGAKEKLLEYLKTNNSDLAVRVILSQG